MRSGATRKFAVLVSNVNRGGSHAVAVKNRNTEFADGVRRESDPALHAAEKRKRGGLPQSLIVDRGVPRGLPHTLNGFAQRGHQRVSMVRTSVARVLLSTRSFHRGCVSQIISAAGNDSRSAATAGKVCTISPREPRRRTRKRGSDMRGLANGVQEDRESNDLSDRRRWRRECPSGRRWRARARCRRCNRCPWHERRGEEPQAETSTLGSLKSTT